MCPLYDLRLLDYDYSFGIQTFLLKVMFATNISSICLQRTLRFHTLTKQCDRSAQR